MRQVFKAVLGQSSVGALIGKLPFIPNWYFDHVWAENLNLFYGVYNSFEAAKTFVSRRKKVGWNDAALAKLLIGDVESKTASEGPFLFQTSQYAVLFWMSKLLKEGVTTLDFGGAGGVFYELCSHYGLLDHSNVWHVVDMPEMIERGHARHAARGSQGISFGSDLSAAPEADILLALGVLQYMEDPLGEWGSGVLDSLKAKPRHIFVNKVALTDRGEFWTLQNHQSTACPYRVFNRADFIAHFELRGYVLKDRWLAPEIDVSIPFHPDLRTSSL